jgi:hypothetical protein
MQRILITFVLPLLFCVPACNSNNPQGRVAVKGEVALEGNPIHEGSIQFESLPGSQPSVMTGGMIRQGKFSISKTDGLVPGLEYTVRIRSMVEVPGDSVAQSAGPMSRMQGSYRDIIPPQFGKHSTLTFTATKKSPNIFQVDMKP